MGRPQQQHNSSEIKKSGNLIKILISRFAEAWSRRSSCFSPDEDFLCLTCWARERCKLSFPPLFFFFFFPFSFFIERKLIRHHAYIIPHSAAVPARSTLTRVVEYEAEFINTKCRLQTLAGDMKLEKKQSLASSCQRQKRPSRLLWAKGAKAGICDGMGVHQC